MGENKITYQHSASIRYIVFEHTLSQHCFDNISHKRHAERHKQRNEKKKCWDFCADFWRWHFNIWQAVCRTILWLLKCNSKKRISVSWFVKSKQHFFLSLFAACRHLVRLCIYQIKFDFGGFWFLSFFRFYSFLFYFLCRINIKVPHCKYWIKTTGEQREKKTE